MTQPTREQQGAIERLRHEYGKESLLSIEHRDTDDWPHGIVRVHWQAAGTIEDQDRNLYIRPDGTRLSWDTIDTD